MILNKFEIYLYIIVSIGLAVHVIAINSLSNGKLPATLRKIVKIFQESTIIEILK